MKEFHGFVKKMLTAWLVVYALLCLPGLGKGLVMFVMADFTMPASHYFDMMGTFYRSALWMVPTVFLLVAYFLSRPVNRISRSF